MRKMNPLPTAEYLRKVFRYDQETGILAWASSRGRVKAGMVAGEETKRGYRVVRIDGVRYAAHRVIYRLALGIDPGLSELDHINGDPSDNRISNLRLASHGQNMRNGRLRRNNTTGKRGVVWREDMHKYQAQIVVNGRNNYLGLFDSAEEASVAYESAARKFHGDYVRPVYKDQMENTNG